MIPGTWTDLPAPDAKSMLVIPDTDTFADSMVMRTLSGLVTRAMHTDTTIMPLWIDTSKPQNSVWRDRFAARNAMNQTAASDLWSTVKAYAQKGVVKGFVVYNEDSEGKNNDASSNIATSLAAPLSAIAVSAGLVDQATSAGLTQLADARTMNFGDLIDQHGEHLSKSTLGLLRTNMPACRDMVVAQGAAVGIDTDNGGYNDLLSHLDSGATIIGYGTSEDGSVHAASEVGAGLVASDWTTNWNVLSLGASDLPLDSVPNFDAPGKASSIVDDGQTYYVGLAMTDGDNVQWVLGDYASSEVWYGAKERGDIPFTWGLPTSSLAQTAPDALSWFQETAKDKDNFMNFGDPYLYIDSSSADPGYGDMVAKHQQWAHAAGLNSALIFCEDWQSAGTQTGVDIIAKSDPQLDAAFMIQYSSYAAGRGAILYGAREDGSKLPVVTAKTHLWAVDETEEGGGPQHIADLLNGWAGGGGGGAIASRVSWVPINAWSNFDMPDGSKVGGYAAARALVALLAPNIKLVTLPEIAKLLKDAPA